MAEYRIQSGEQENFVWIGVQPPAFREISEVLKDLRPEVDGVAHVMVKTRTPLGGEPYAEMTYRKDQFDDAGLVIVGIERALTEAGHSVVVEPGDLNRRHELFAPAGLDSL